jgi:hypothetical protein
MFWSVRHVSERTEDWQRALIATIFQIHATAPEREDILAFLTGTVRGNKLKFFELPAFREKRKRISSL